MKLNVFIEIPKGSGNKYELDKETNKDCFGTGPFYSSVHFSF